MKASLESPSSREKERARSPRKEVEKLEDGGKSVRKSPSPKGHGEPKADTKERDVPESAKKDPESASKAPKDVNAVQSELNSSMFIRPMERSDLLLKIVKARGVSRY